MTLRPAGLLAALLLLPMSAVADVVRLSEPVAATEAWEDFGAPLPEGPARSLAEVVEASDAMDGEDVKIATEVVQVCQKKGCFFIARDGEATARVTFRDYEFFVPTDSAGKQVVLAGTFERRAISGEQAAHYAEDLGETPPADPDDGFEYAIVADAIRVPRG